MVSLKLMALDEDDLQVLSIHLQDALLRTDEIAWRAGDRRFVALLNRFDWQQAQAAEDEGRQQFERRRCALRFDRVLNVRSKNFKPGARGVVLELLALRFVADEEPPSGHIELIFADDCAICLRVECIEAALTDIGQSWRARSRPSHEEGEQGEGKQGEG